MTDRIKLADELEAAEAACRNLDARIHFLIKSGIGCGMAQDAPRYTSSIDAAMTLSDEEEMAQHMREAFSMVQMLGWPVGDFTGQLARFIASAALKAGE